MNDDYIALIDYNRWANRHVVEACRKLTPEQYGAEPVPGWSSARATLTHLAIATEAWFRGLSGENVERFPTEAELPTVDDAAQLLGQADQVFDRLSPKLTREWLATPMTVRGRSRFVVVPPWVILRHIVNHGTYHRGQLASKLKRFAVEQPPTDFLIWAFEKFPQQAPMS
jgi:uncharacterized damage-inducible protein DinB